jgi:hypothetical protein
MRNSPILDEGLQEKRDFREEGLKPAIVARTT